MNRVTRFNPAREIVTLREAMNRLFEDSFVSGQLRREDGDPLLRLPIEAYATDHEIVVRAAVPGVKPEDVDISIEGDTLTLRGEFPKPMDAERMSYIFAERPWGRFIRTLQLTVPVEADKAEAVFENGLLTLTLHKSEAVRPKIIPVRAKHA